MMEKAQFLDTTEIKNVDGFYFRPKHIVIPKD
jgi:hypothetical protein